MSDRLPSEIDTDCDMVDEYGLTSADDHWLDEAAGKLTSLVIPQTKLKGRKLKLVQTDGGGDGEAE